MFFKNLQKNIVKLGVICRRFRISRLNIRKVTVITTMNTPSQVYKDMFNNSLEGSLLKGTFRQIGITDVDWVSLNEVKQTSQEQRNTWLSEIQLRFTKP